MGTFSPCKGDIALRVGGFMGLGFRVFIFCGTQHVIEASHGKWKIYGIWGHIWDMFRHVEA